MMLFFCSEHWILNLDVIYAKRKIEEKVYGFLDNLIWIGNGKFSLFLREYSKLAVNVLSSSPKISDLIKNNFN